MDINELITQAKVAGGARLADVPDGKARALVRAVFQQINKQLAENSEEPVRIPGLGVFRSNQVERERDGTKQSITRIHFRPLRPKA